MKLLLDENLPEKLKNDLPEHEVYTIRQKGWKGKTNGELLKLMLKENFDAFITADKHLSYQQNFKEYPVAVVVLSAKRINYSQLKPLVPKINKTLKKKLKAGVVVVS